MLSGRKYMELEELYGLITEFRKSGLGKLEYKNGECDIKLEMPEAAPVYNTFAAFQPAGAVTTAAPVPGAAVSQPAAAAAVTPAPSAPAATPPGTIIKSPLVGTYYAAPSETAQPYVTTGSTVKKGETVCIIEAMKMMNEVTAPCNCIIEEIFKENATAAGFDEPLFRIKEI